MESAGRNVDDHDPVRQAGRAVDDLVADHVESVGDVEGDRGAAGAGPDPRGAPVVRSIETGSEEGGADALALQRGLGRHPAQLDVGVARVIRHRPLHPR